MGENKKRKLGRAMFVMAACMVATMVYAGEKAVEDMECNTQNTVTGPKPAAVSPGSAEEKKPVAGSVEGTAVPKAPSKKHP